MLGTFEYFYFLDGSCHENILLISIIFPFSAYCQQLEDMISEKIEAFHDLREKARNFRSCMRDEEAKSRLLMHRN